MEDTFPKIFVQNAQRWNGKQVAIRKKRLGLWEEYTWSQCLDMVKGLFYGFQALGIQAGNRVSILGDNNPEWFWSQLAIQAARGIITGLNPSGDLEETKGLLLLSQPRFVLAQDQEQVDKVLALKKDIPSIEKVIYWNGKGLQNYAEPTLLSMYELRVLGESHEQDHLGTFERKLAHGSGEDIAMMLFALGADGKLKVIPATHRFLIGAARDTLCVSPVCERDEYVSIISPAWFFEQTLGFGACVLNGQKLNFAESSDTGPEDSREISPQSIVYPTKLWERLAEEIDKNISNGRWLKRTLYNRCMELGAERSDCLCNGRTLGPYKKVLCFLSEWTLYRPLRDKHGLNRARVVYSAGEALSADTIRFFRSMGIEIKQIFGSVNAGIVTVDPGEARID